MSDKSLKSLRLVLADQLTHTVAALQGIDAEHDVILLAEVRSELAMLSIIKRKLFIYFQRCVTLPKS